MCGISGIVKKTSEIVSKEEVNRMNNQIIHRGPDAEGIYLSENLGLGHRRLSIIDLTEAANQPMHKQGRYHIVFNGEIYNYLEIKKELVNEGVTFVTNSDTEVILASYEKWGVDCVNHFNGMWSFALYDDVTKKLLLSRDRFGIKPLYYCKNDTGFYFGSEIKQLLPFNGKAIANSKILVEYLVTGIMDHTQETFFKGITKLLPGHNLIIDISTQAFTTNQYYVLKDNIKGIIGNEKEAISRYETELERAINYRLRSDVAVGTCLSGGIDSSLIASISSAKYNKSSGQLFKAIHAKSTENTNDESHFAQIVAKASNIDLNIIEPKQSDFLELLDDVVGVQEEPFRSPSIYMQYFVMQKAKEIGCTVMLDGQGGDETMLGYNKYFALYLNDVRKKQGIGAFKRELKKIKENSNQSLKHIMKFYFGMKYSKLRLKAHLREYSFVKKEYYLRSDFSFLDNISDSLDDYKKLQVLEMESTNLPILLRYEDKNSMQHSIETRLPLIDHKLVETAIQIPLELKMKEGWSKYLLRKVAEKELPDEITWRKGKFGFEAPSKTWLKGYDKSTLQESIILNSYCKMEDLLKKFDTMDEDQQWRVISIAKWEQKFNVSMD